MPGHQRCKEKAVKGWGIDKVVKKMKIVLLGE
jgi:hypothetical protein